METDTGHRVPNHNSKCRHMHGHRYRWEAELEAGVAKKGVSEEGMLMDFLDASSILNTVIHDVLDHVAFLAFEDDHEAKKALL